VDEAVLASEKAHVASNYYISGFIGLDVALDGTPAAKVAPGEVVGNDVDAAALFHDGVVDGDFVAGREEAAELSLFGRGEKGWLELVHDGRYLRSKGAQFFYDSLYVPHEDTGIPEVVAIGKIGLGGLQGRFFLEFGDLYYLSAYSLGCVNLPVSGLRPCGGDAYSDYGV